MEKRVAVNGVEIAYEEHGRGARPLVLVHGFTGSRRDFAPRLAELAALGRVVALDLRGHGASTNTGDAAGYTLAQLADDLLEFLASAGIDCADVLGHSMGGMALLRAALADDRRIGSLILMDTTAGPLRGIRRDLLELAGQVARQVGMARLVEILRERAPTDAHRTAADRELEARWGAGYWEDWRYPNFRSMDPVAYGALGAEMFDQASLAPRLGAIDRPSLVLVGEGDDNFIGAADELARGIRGARLALIPDAGHQPQLENPRAWLAAIEAHLRRVRDR